jgi:hypothetical protein
MSDNAEQREALSTKKGGRHENQEQCEGWIIGSLEVMSDSAELKEKPYQPTKGGCHENEEQCEGWTHYSPLNRCRAEQNGEKPYQPRKEDAMKTKSNVKAGTRPIKCD